MMGEAGGNDDPIVVKLATVLVVGRITDRTPEELIVCANEVMLRVNDMVVLSWEVGKLILVNRFNVCTKLSVFDAADKL